jgi:hypothetical protein
MQRARARARARQLGWLAAIVLGAAAWSLAGPATAQKDGDDKAFEKSIEETLRKVIDLGANIYNKQSDYNGCFRLYEGALLTLKPVLNKYPELQKAIDNAIDQAYTMVRVDERAHALRAVLGTIRIQFNPALRPANGDKKGDAKDDKKTEDKRDDKKKEKLPDPSLAQVMGHVTVSHFDRRRRGTQLRENPERWHVFSRSGDSAGGIHGCHRGRPTAAG